MVCCGRCKEYDAVDLLEFTDECEIKELRGITPVCQICVNTCGECIAVKKVK